jgi:hypothetical protein
MRRLISNQTLDLKEAKVNYPVKNNLVNLKQNTLNFIICIKIFNKGNKILRRKILRNIVSNQMHTNMLKERANPIYPHLIKEGIPPVPLVKSTLLKVFQ